MAKVLLAGRANTQYSIDGKGYYGGQYVELTDNQITENADIVLDNEGHPFASEQHEKKYGKVKKSAKIEDVPKPAVNVITPLPIINPAPAVKLSKKKVR
ncbi:hypothetical protein HYU06_07335 [Candidatus Woesearchaeota archaeon]|nr:hypothetical protein [Candidatus Woesearchaeota archaeon]